MSTLSLNVGNFVTLRLTPSNYPLWREQALALAESQEMLSETFKSWRKTDRLLRGWIIGTLSEEALGLIVGLDTSYAVWEALKNAYAQDSQEREFTLRQQITYLRKEDNTTITEHIRTFKGICDNLSAIGKTIPDQE
ncbi:26S protease regulatory protein [Salix suchowensis]|nr:26S protease regulatory protein [Salix suchowensis]